MEHFRNNTPEGFGEYKVLSARDYKNDIIRDMATGEVTPTGLPSSNVLYYDMNDNAWLCIPSVRHRAEDQVLLWNQGELP